MLTPFKGEPLSGLGLPAHLALLESRLGRNMGSQRGRAGEDSDGRVFAQALQGYAALVVLDEGHKIKDTEGQSFAAVEGLEADFHVIVSATPFLNRTGDAEAYLRLVAPHMLQSHTTWHVNADTDLARLVEDVYVNRTGARYDVLDSRYSSSQSLLRV